MKKLKKWLRSENGLKIFVAAETIFLILCIVMAMITHYKHQKNDYPGERLDRRKEETKNVGIPFGHTRKESVPPDRGEENTAAANIGMTVKTSSRTHGQSAGQEIEYRVRDFVLAYGRFLRYT